MHALKLANAMLFLSTLSLRRATRYWSGVFVVGCAISIHALLAESDTLLCMSNAVGMAFLSTLSLRRATIHSCSRPSQQSNFYPRSPCGERLHLFASSGVDFAISIHALLAESDADTLTDDVSTGGFLSTLSLRRATATSSR